MIMIVVIAKCIVAEGKVDEFVKVATPLVEETRKEAGNISYEIIQSASNPMEVAFLEKWESQEILDLHMKTPHFTSIVPLLGELTVGEMAVSINQILV